MIMLSLIKIKNKPLLYLSLLLAVFIASFYTSQVVHADGTQPTYTLSYESLISAKGGFISDPNVTSIPMFRKDGDKWVFGEGENSHNKDYYNEDTAEIYFKYSRENELYITHTQYATNNGVEAVTDKGERISCDVAIKIDANTRSGGSFVGVRRDDNLDNQKEDSDCTSAVRDIQQLGSNQVAFGNISEPTGETFMGVTIETCKKDDSACKARRKEQIKKADAAIVCTTSSQDSIERCNYYKSIITCLKSSPSISVATCTTRANATRILDGNYSIITAEATDEYINQTCRALQDKNDRQECVDKATKERDRLKGEKEKCEKNGGTWNNSTGECTPAEPTTSCSVEGVGWIICPIMNFMGGLNDAAFGFISDFLTIEPKLLTDNDTRAAWSNFRDIANVAFVIVFLIIVYSQITGTGVSNYGIKRMLPRLFIAAVLVNLSYFVCQIAVDLSNILGSSIYSFFKDMPTTDAISATASDLPSWKKVIGFVLVGAAALVVGLLAITTISTAALLAFALIILILIARKAALILLVVVSPLAFVAYLLPNTEKWFKKWWKMFSSLLLVFPVVGVIFGASTLAARIINNAGGDPDESNYMLQITALGVMAVPLFAVPIVLKSALSATGSIGAKLSGMADRAQGAAASRNKKRFSEQAERMKKDVGNRWNIAAHNKEGWLGSSKLGAYSRYKTRRDSLLASREGEAKRSGSTYMANQLGDTDANGNYTERAIKLQNAAAGGSAISQADESARVRAAAVATQGIHKQFDDDVSAFKTTLTSASNDQLIGMISDTALSSEQRAAAAGLVMSRSHRESHIRALDIATKLMNEADTTGNSKEVEALSSVQKQMAYDMKDKPWALGDQATGQLVEGKLGQVMHDSDGKIMKDAKGNPLRVTDMQEEINKRVGTKLSAASLASMNPDEMKRIHKAALNGELNDSQKASLKTAINEARSNPQINNLIKPEAKVLHDAILNKIAKDEQDAAAATYGPNI
ncbi:hypothetical protein RAAC3_TM7C00001G0322 [Candidatus Saccharibacteria bacterium RAAC3_TM7_1]|nr:hypothetical protein RAAC3_TM7C00001G0322 [Candidatus Saccharibacteria bacterium RAAC3_TM7_1]